MKTLYCLLLTLAASDALAQIANTRTMDTTDFNYQGKITIEGYVDGYYAYDFNRPGDGNKPYAVSMSRHNEMTVNLAFIDLKYSSSRLRSRVVPAFGTYVNANYADEPGVLKNLLEASAGVKLSRTKAIWLDFGVFGSPYTNESAISKDHLAYTRSFAPEYVPYYLSGLKLSATLSGKVNAYLYVVNGWQQIQDNNSGKSIGTQLEYRPGDHWLINWNTYVGSERSAVKPDFTTRYFSDVYFIYARGRWSSTGCIYAGRQDRSAEPAAFWWQANLIGRYNLTGKLSMTGRVEYFSDPSTVVVISSPGPFTTYSGSLGLNYKPADNMLLRVEHRTYFSQDDVYTRNGSAVATGNVLTSNITIWF